MKIIFLDFDGVLNNGRFLFNHMSDYPDLIMEEKVEILNYIMGEIDAEIVFSTSWREEFTLDGLVKILEKVGFKYGNKCVGVTPIAEDNERVTEIKDYIKANNVKKFVVLNDNAEELSGFGGFSHKLITDPNFGITMEDAKHIIELFKTQDRMEEE